MYLCTETVYSACTQTLNNGYDVAGQFILLYYILYCIEEIVRVKRTTGVCEVCLEVR